MPGLGLKRGLGKDLVVAPYATALAVDDRARAARRRTSGRWPPRAGEGPFGFYEAIDFTPDRLPKGERCEVVRSYMAHHQGMSLVRPGQPAARTTPMPRRFHAEPMVRAVELLLQERVPLDAPEVRPPEAGHGARAGAAAAADARQPPADHAGHARPRGPHLLSNGHYT